MKTGTEQIHQAQTKSGKPYRVEAHTFDGQAWFTVYVLGVDGSFREIRNAEINTVVIHNGRNTPLKVQLTADDAEILQQAMDAYRAEHVTPAATDETIPPMTLAEQAALDSGPDYSDDTVEGRLNNYRNGVAYDLHPMDPMAERIR